MALLNSYFSLIMHHILRLADGLQHGLGLRGAEIGVGGFGHQGFQGLPVPVLQGGADGGGADGLAALLQSRDDPAGNALLRQGLAAPINDLSRGCNADEVYKMAIITAAMV